jgi:hypothetical protein
MDLVGRMQDAVAKAKGATAKVKLAFQVYWDMCWDSSAPIRVAYREWQSLSDDATKRYIEHENRTLEFFADLIRAGVASGEFPAVSERLIASEMIMLAQMRAVKGWMTREFSKEDIFADHWALIGGRLRKTRGARVSG